MEHSINYSQPEFCGEVNEQNHPHGLGVLICKCNKEPFTISKYCGTFKDGKKNGEGIEYVYNNIDNTCIRMIATWKDNTLKHGEISQYSEDFVLIRKMYKGDFNEDKQYHGSGVIFHSNGKIKYEGEFQNNNMEGKGKLYFDNGQIKYKGRFTDNEFHDQYGVLYNDMNQVIYEGAFENGKRCGTGTEFIYQSMTKTIKYKGIWKNDMYHGKGNLKTNEFVYTGEFVEGKFNGYGIIEYIIKEAVYKGFFKDGLKHGKGKFTTFGNYSIEYEGDWVDDKKEGYGLYRKYGMYPHPYRNIPNIYKGEFLNDIFNGKGKYTYYHGDTYEGEYLDNKRHGFGIMYYNNKKTKYEGEWRDDMKYGPGKLYNKDGQCTEAIWEYDRIVSKSKKRMVNYVPPLLPNEKKQRIEQIEQKDIVNIPHEYKCPIGLSIMKYPVICSDGHTYDAENITNLFNRMNKIHSPITREILDKDIKIPNHNLRKMIEDFLKNNQ